MLCCLLDVCSSLSSLIRQHFFKIIIRKKTFIVLKVSLSLSAFMCLFCGFFSFFAYLLHLFLIVSLYPLSFSVLLLGLSLQYKGHWGNCCWDLMLYKLHLIEINHILSLNISFKKLWSEIHHCDKYSEKRNQEVGQHFFCSTLFIQ